MKLDNQTIMMVVVAIVLGMLVANMFKEVCGCKVVEGQCDADDAARNKLCYWHYRGSDGEAARIPSSVNQHCYNGWETMYASDPERVNRYTSTNSDGTAMRSRGADEYCRGHGEGDSQTGATYQYSDCCLWRVVDVDDPCEYPNRIYCGSQGSCDSATGTCVCNPGWSGEHCQTPPPPPQLVNGCITTPPPPPTTASVTGIPILNWAMVDRCSQTAHTATPATQLSWCTHNCHQAQPTQHCRTCCNQS